MFRFLLLLFLASSIRVYGYGVCDSPRYEHVGSLKSSEGLLRIVVAPHDLTLEKLICLAGTLKTQHREWQNIRLLIFTSKTFAEHFTDGPRVELPAAAKRAQDEMHVVYVFDRQKQDEHIDILPFGWRTSSADATRINLPVVGSPHCRFEVSGRCLIGMPDNFQYPLEALRVQASGTVTLAGTITPTGRVVNVRTKDATVPPSEQTLLVDAAVRNFSLWQLEARTGTEIVEIAYIYQIKNSLEHNSIDVKLNFPNGIVISGNP